MKDLTKAVIFNLVLLFLPFLFLSPVLAQKKQATFWEFQSIDTMKYSRDLSREKLKDRSFDKIIDEQVGNIAQTGATYVAIATPYDEEFLPFLKRWVASARKNNLKVWFRGNWSGWEKWFDYPPIDRQAHLTKTKNFILKNGDLFEDGDIFSACPECENGGPGDPRVNKDTAGYRKFLIEEYQITKDAFREIGKNVKSNFDSMNADVARSVMDKETTRQMDGLVVIDHYVATSEQMIKDVKQLAVSSGGKIVFGEFGAPIEGIHGQMTEDEQARWIEDALKKLVAQPEVLGVSYWTSVGSSTSLWNAKGQPKKAVESVKKIFTPLQISGTVKDEIGQPIPNVKLRGSERETTTDSKGYFILPYLQENQALQVTAQGYLGGEIKISPQKTKLNLVLKKEREDFFFDIFQFLKNLFS